MTTHPDDAFNALYRDVTDAELRREKSAFKYDPLDIGRGGRDETVGDYQPTLVGGDPYKPMTNKE